MIILIAIILMTLATATLSDFFLNKDGPFNVFYAIRDQIGIDQDYDPIEQTFLQGIFSCFDCFSFWAALSITILCFPVLFIYYPWYLALPLTIILPFAISRAVIILDRYTL